MSYLSDRQYGRLSHQSFLHRLKNSSSITKRLILDHTLNAHRGCVNTICWNETGTTILSGSDDEHLIVTDPYTTKVLTKVHSGHRENIFSAKFLPGSDDREVVSCSGDGMIFHTNLDRGFNVEMNNGCFNCHDTSTTYEVRVIPRTPNLFLSCSDDGTVRLFDLRTKSRCLKELCYDDILIKSRSGITSIDVNPMNSNEIVCACADSSIRLYDHRKLSNSVSSDRIESSLQGLVSCFVLADRKQSHRSRITSVVFNPYGNEILASYASESLYLLDPKQTLSQEQIQQKMIEKRDSKRTNSDDSQSALNSAAERRKTNRQIKRLRLGGDWSDTGPDARPTSEIGTPDTSNQEPRNLQNTFMQRMSDIFTQLMTRTTVESEQTDEENASPTEDRQSQQNGNLDFLTVAVDEDDEEEEEESDDQTSHPMKLKAEDRKTERSYEENFLRNIPSLGLLNSFDGHRNARTMIKEANFWSDSFVMSGSDCGHIFIWNKFTGEILRIIQADEHVVNCVQPHPLNHPILASSGIDYNIKLFSPLAEKSIDDSEQIRQTVKRNHAMIEETSSTITVPATFMFRILTSMYRLQHADEISDFDED